jgi:hypothetical protein
MNHSRSHRAICMDIRSNDRRLRIRIFWSQPWRDPCSSHLRVAAFSQHVVQGISLLAQVTLPSLSGLHVDSGKGSKVTVSRSDRSIHSVRQRIAPAGQNFLTARIPRGTHCAGFSLHGACTRLGLVRTVTQRAVRNQAGLFRLQ